MTPCNVPGCRCTSAHPAQPPPRLPEPVAVPPAPPAPVVVEVLVRHLRCLRCWRRWEVAGDDPLPLQLSCPWCSGEGGR